jgi:hypothetical protein
MVTLSSRIAGRRTLHLRGQMLQNSLIFVLVHILQIMLKRYHKKRFFQVWQAVFRLKEAKSLFPGE